MRRANPFDARLFITYLIVTVISSLLFGAFIFTADRLGASADFIDACMQLIKPVGLVFTVCFFFVGAVNSVLKDSRKI